MDILQKKLLGWGGFGLMVLLGAFLIVTTKQAYNTATTTNTVSFSGQGTVTAKPDIALVDLSIVTDAATSKAAQDDNSARSKTVTAFLKKQNIDDKDIKTTGYNIYPQYDWIDGKNHLRGYEVSQAIQVKVRDLTAVDDVLAGVVSAGANQIGQLRLTVEDPEKLTDQARAQAIAQAKEKADKLRDQLGIRLGRIINFAEGTQGGPVPLYLKADAYGRGGMGGGGPDIPVGENEITVDVTITYQIR